jgi:hypothetical protein
MKHNLSVTEITQIVDSFEGLNDEKLENLSKQLVSKQPYLTSLIEAAYEIFEEEEEYTEDLDYHFLLVDYIFTKTLGETDTIMPDLLENKDEEHMKIIDSIAESEDFDDRLFELFESHPRTDLIMYFYDDLFDDEIEFDDQSLELTTQLMLMIFFIIDVYHYSTMNANEA